MRLYDYTASANCYKPRLLLALLEQPYERVAVDIFAGETLTDEYAELNPARETPVLVLDDGRVLTQSNAILWFLAEGTPFLPDSPFERAQVAQWLFFEQEWVMPGIGGTRFRLVTGRGPGRPDLGRDALGLLERRLSDRAFLVGSDCSIADLSNFAYTHVADDAGLGLDGYPAVCAWLDRVRSLPRFVDDLEPYPANARPGAGRSIYD
jgi:glutathione S-transferase